MKNRLLSKLLLVLDALAESGALSVNELAERFSIPLTEIVPWKLPPENLWRLSHPLMVTRCSTAKSKSSGLYSVAVNVTSIWRLPGNIQTNTARTATRIPPAITQGCFFKNLMTPTPLSYCANTSPRQWQAPASARTTHPRSVPHR